MRRVRVQMQQNYVIQTVPPPCLTRPQEYLHCLRVLRRELDPEATDFPVRQCLPPPTISQPLPVYRQAQTEAPDTALPVYRARETATESDCTS